MVGVLSPARISALLAVLLCGCGGGGEPPAGREGGVLRVWAHSGREGEREAIRHQVTVFNRDHPEGSVALTLLPEGGYNAQVQAAALAGDLPDVLEFDGPFVSNYAWQGQLRPLDDLLPAATRERLIPSIVAQGTYRGALYSVGQFDSGLGLYGLRSRLEAVGARIPSRPEQAWSAGEMDEILGRLAERDPDRKVLDLKLNYTGEWFTYAFAPVIASAGGQLIDLDADHGRGRSEGALDGPAAVAAMRRIQSWIVERGYVDPDLDDRAFLDGRVALSWVGHWEYERYHHAHGDDLVLMPLPDFGRGSRTGQGSWSWGITTGCRAPERAAAFLEYLLGDGPILEVVRTNAAVPATRSAIAASPLYQPGGPLHLFALQLTSGTAVPRPRTPAYPVVTDAFQQAFDDIRHGADVRTALHRAAQAIDRDVADNQGYRTTQPAGP